MKVLSIVFVLAVGALSYPAHAEQKPWQWTIEQRLEKRFDGESIGVRRSIYDAKHLPRIRAANLNVDDAVPAFSNNIDGAHNPERFLPHELFEGLLSGLGPDEELARKQRRVFRAGIRALGYDERVFWPQLRFLAERYLSLRHARRTTPATAETADQLSCARNEALDAARASFARFDEFLYTVIAPLRESTTSGDEELARKWLRRAAEACR